MKQIWFKEAGFKQNPYDTRALSSETSVDLLFGREKEIKRVKDALASCSIPLLIGANGVGKTSIANVAVYQMIEEGKNDQKIFLPLYFNAIETVDSSNYAAFRNNVYRQIGLQLVSSDTLLDNCKIPKFEKKAVRYYVKDLIHGSGGFSLFGNGADFGADANPNGETSFIKIIEEWLKKCFLDLEKGGFICILDNLENIGTPDVVRHFLEEARDTYFNIPGVRWILCGTATALEKALSSSILDGYLMPIAIRPTPMKDVKQLIRHRIDKCKGANTVDIPVDELMFSMLYDEMNMQLRTTLSLCEDFANHLFSNTERKNIKCDEELKRWLKQKSAELPEKEYEINEKTWTLFDKLTMFCDDDIHLSDYQTDFTDDEVSKAVEILIKKQLVDQIEKENEPIYRITKKGWLVHYRRKSIGNKTGVVGTTVPSIIPRKIYTLKNEMLTDADCQEIISLMQGGGLCVLPSDSSYTLTGIPTIPGVTETINTILQRNRMAMSLAFSDITQAAQIVQLSNMAYRFIQALTPGGLTFVARLSNNGYAKFSARRLYTDGTIGVRLTESKVETQLAKNFPLPSTPIRNKDKKEVATMKEAVRVLCDYTTINPVSRHIVAIDGAVPYCGRLSTVVKEEYKDGYWYISVKREGVIDLDTLRDTAIMCDYRDLLLP